MVIDGANSVYRGVEGSGAAFLFPQTHNEAISIYQRAQENKQRRQLADQRQLNDDMEMLSKTKPWVVDLPEFQKDRSAYIDMVAKAHQGKYLNDPEYMKKKLTAAEMIYAKQLRSSYHEKQADDYMRDIARNPELYDDDALQKVEEYKNTPLSKRPDNLIIPQLNPADGVKYFYNMTPPARTNKGYTVDANGIKKTTATTAFDEDEAKRLAEQQYNNSDNKAVKAFSKQSQKMLISDLAAAGKDFNSLPPTEQQKLLKDKFVTDAVDLMRIKFKPSYSENISNAPSNSQPKQMSLKEADAAQLYTPKQINTVTGDGKEAVVETAGTMEVPKGARGAGKVTISKNTTYFDPTTNKFKKREEAGNMDFEPGEISVIPMKNGKWAPYVFGKEVKLEEGIDGNGNPIQKAIKSDIAVPLDEVKNLLTKGKVQYQWAFEKAKKLNEEAPKKTAAPSQKTVTTSKIKSLVGTKGYEGYTFDELKKYYSDNGYTVK